MVKLTGCCTNCDKEVYEIIQRYASDHFLSGEPRKIGKPLDIAVIYNIILADGSSMTLTYCDECECDLPRDWPKVLRTFQREMSDKYLIAIGNKPITNNYDSWFLLLVNQLPVMVVGKNKVNAAIIRD